MAQYFPLRPHLTPWIYAYSNPAPAYKGLLKVGYTTRSSVEERIKEQFNVEQPEGLKPYRIEFKESAMRSDGSAFTDKDVHNTFVHTLKLFLDMVHKSEHTMPTTNGEGEHGAATARPKLEPGGGNQFPAVGSNRTLTGK